MSQRADFGSKADGYFNSLEDNVGPLALALRSLVCETIPGAVEVIKWGIPVYELNNQMWFCSIRSGKGYAALQFGADWTSLPDPDGLLEGTGKKLRHVKIRSKDDIKPELFASWIRQTAGANSQVIARVGR